MLVWGYGGDTIDMGKVHTQHCSTCERSRDYHLMLHYRYFHFYWFMSFVTKREYSLRCHVCDRGWVLTAAEAKQYRSDNKSLIPFWREYGLLTLFVCGSIFSMLMPVIHGISQAFSR
jgi:hypothetical protein